MPTPTTPTTTTEVEPTTSRCVMRLRKENGVFNFAIDEGATKTQLPTGLDALDFIGAIFFTFNRGSGDPMYFVIIGASDTNWTANPDETTFKAVIMRMGNGPSLIYNKETGVLEMLN